MKAEEAKPKHDYDGFSYKKGSTDSEENNIDLDYSDGDP